MVHFMETFIYLLLGVVAVIGIYVIVTYNQLVRLKHNVKTAWSNIDVLLLQRHDELPKLVATCKQHMAYEKETLERVIAARSQVSHAREMEDSAGLAAAEGLMASSLGKLFALAEDYPELQASHSFLQLQNRISTLEESLADRREFYNASVNLSNATIDSFPVNLIAAKFFFFKSKLLEVSQAVRKDVDVEALFNR